MSESLLRAASALGVAGKHTEAAALYRQVLDREPRNFHALHGLGVICYRSGRLQDAEELISGAISVNPGASDALFSLGAVLMAGGKFAEAMQYFDGALRIKPDYIEARGNKAALLLRTGRNAEALAECDILLALRRDMPQAWGMKSAALLGLNRPADALATLDQGLKFTANSAALWRDRAFVLMNLQRPRDALSSLENAQQLEPRNAEFALRRADLLAMLKQNEEAIAAYDKALALNPNESDGWNRRGIALVEIGRKDPDALHSFERAVAYDPTNTEARHNRANVLFELKRFAESAREFEKVLQQAPATAYARGFLIQARLRTCDWRALEQDRQRLSLGIAKGERVIDPQGYLSICRNAEEQQRCARIFMQDELQPAPARARARRQDSKIRIAYISADFRPHPVAFLIAGVFEHHNRQEFELTGISLGHAGSSSIRERIVSAFGDFVDAARLNDEQAAVELVRRDIDIAVDLTGFTDGCRPGILLRRPAPIQVNFLGFPGTMGSPHIDYIIADKFLIPESEQRFYTEQVVYMPHTYQANDSRREVSARVFSRREAGLPDDGFVFCCFNNNYKITPEMFGIWMRILAQVPDSVLWLLQDNVDAAANLRREATARGVNPRRLIFAPRITPAEHLARQRLADLFLDTSPYSAHTTCSDALFVGLPVLSFYGPTFPAHVAVSLLNAVGMSDLATQSLGEYEARALFLARNRDELQHVKAKLMQNREDFPLFNTARFTRNLEQAYREMLALHDQGMPPRSFAVEESL